MPEDENLQEELEGNDSLKEELREFFFMLVSNYVHYPDELRVEVGSMGGGLAVRITPKEFDYGKINGRGGENIMALSTIGTEIARHKSVPLRVMLMGPTKPPAKGPEIPYVVDPLWNTERIKPIVKRILQVCGKEHIRVLMKKNPGATGEYFFAIEGFQTEEEREFGGALGRLMIAIGRTQGAQLISPAEDRRGRFPT